MLVRSAFKQLIKKRKTLGCEFGHFSLLLESNIISQSLQKYNISNQKRFLKFFINGKILQALPFQNILRSTMQLMKAAIFVLRQILHVKSKDKK